MFEQVCPILPSRDFDATEDFYARIGFTQYYRDGGYMLMNDGKVELHFFHAPNHKPEESTHGAYIRPSNVDTASAEISKLGLPDAAGFPRFAPAEDKPWHMREATVWDPDGNILRIGEALEIG